jgi:hypothetical protein
MCFAGRLCAGLLVAEVGIGTKRKAILKSIFLKFSSWCSDGCFMVEIYLFVQGPCSQ